MKIAIIGSGTMGSSIAAHIANCGYEVLLLDLPDDKTKNRNHILEKSINRIAGSSLITHPKRLNHIKIGNLEDDINQLHNYDLVIEAVVEKIEVKLELFKKISKFLNKDCIIASNTSTLLLKLLKQENIWPHTIIIHFFNPVRYVSLVELISDSEIPQNKIEQISKFLTYNLGRSVIKCNDSPGFIANRIGCFFLELAVHKAAEQKLDIQIIDSLANQFLFMPKTAIFGLYDLIGLDVMSLIGKSLTSVLPTNDKYHSVCSNGGLTAYLINQGFLGSKTKCGFYKKENNQKFVLNLESLEYLPLKEKTQLPNNLNDFPDQRYSDYFKDIVRETYEYALTLVLEVTSDINDIDKVMELGFNWKYGPIKLAQKYHNQAQTTNLSNKKPFEGNVVVDNHDASLYEYKDNFIFSLNTKLNILTSPALELLNKSVEVAESKNKKLIIYSSNKHFSAGGDLKFFLELAKNKNFMAIRQFLKLGQNTFQALKYSKTPVIAVAQNLALGGGCELLLHSNLVVSGIELQAGLVEVGVGLIPSWGGLKEMILRANGDSKLLLKLINNILYQNKTSSADFFVEDYLAKVEIVAHPDYLLENALNFDATNWLPLQRNSIINIPGVSLLDQDLSGFDEHTVFIANKIEKLLAEKQVSEDYLLEAEVEIFVDLISKSQAIEKISKILNI
jgi:3-hydroxyacyl-CoA dehydrogenase/enoyl-CoA hydratase/3-hydroxybutyryl-CoA epimerase